MLRWFEHSQVFVPSRVMEFSCADLGLMAEDVDFFTEDKVRLNGWYFPVLANTERSHLVLLLLHGNGGNLCHRYAYYQAWLELGVNVFAFDYRGYGRSEGQPTEPGTYLDAQAAWRWLRLKNFKPEYIILLGKSLGGGVASELALREQIGGLILQNTFTSMPELGAELFPWLPVRWLGSIQYNTRQKLPKVTVPMLIAHSRGDELIRFHHAERNFAAANEPKMLWEIYGSHNGTLEAGRDHYLKGLDLFLTRHFNHRPVVA